MEGDAVREGLDDVELTLLQGRGVGAVATEVARQHDGVHLARGQQRVHDPVVGAEILLPGTGQVDRVNDRGRRGKHGCQAGGGVLTQTRHEQTGTTQRVRGQRALATRVADHRNAATSRQRAAEQQVGQVDGVGGRLDQDRTGGAAGGSHDVGGGGQGAGVRARGDPAGLARPDGQHHHGLAGLAQPQHRRHQGPAVGEVFQVEHHGPGGLVVDEVVEQVDRGHVDLVAHRDETRDAEPGVSGQSGDLEPELA